MCFLPFAIEVEMTGRPNEATSHQAKPVVQVRCETIGEDWCIWSYKDDTKTTSIIVGVGRCLVVVNFLEMKFVIEDWTKKWSIGSRRDLKLSFQSWIMFPVLVDVLSENFRGISCTFLSHVMERNRKGTASVFRSSNILMQGIHEEVWQVYFIFVISWCFRHQLSQKGSTITSSSKRKSYEASDEHLDIWTFEAAKIDSRMASLSMHWTFGLPTKPTRTAPGLAGAVEAGEKQKKTTTRRRSRGEGVKGVDGKWWFFGKCWWQYCYAGQVTQRWFWIELSKWKHINCFTIHAQERRMRQWRWQSPGVSSNCLIKMQEFSEQ